MEEKLCKNCIYYLKDFGFSVQGFYPREHGDCTFYLKKFTHKKANQTCENFSFREPDPHLKIIENKCAAKELIEMRDKLEHILFITQDKDEF